MNTFSHRQKKPSSLGRKYKEECVEKYKYKKQNIAICTFNKNMSKEHKNLFPQLLFKWNKYKELKIVPLLKMGGEKKMKLVQRRKQKIHIIKS